MKKLLVVLLMVSLLPVVASADISMVAMKSNGGGEYVVWHPDGTVSLYVHQTVDNTQKLIKIRSLDPADYPLKSRINPMERLTDEK